MTMLMQQALSYNYSTLIQFAVGVGNGIITFVLCYQC